MSAGQSFEDHRNLYHNQGTAGRDHPHALLPEHNSQPAFLPESSSLPGVVSGIRDHLLAIGRHRYWELDCLTIFFLIVRRFRDDLSILATVQVLDYTHFDRF